MTDGLDRTKQGKRHHEVKTYVVHQGVYEKSPAVKLRGFWWEQRESNPRPSACKADALNQLSYAPETGLQIYGHFSNLQI